MKNKTVTKLWQGKYVSVRDYEIEQAIRQGGLKVIHNDKTMELKPEELKIVHDKLYERFDNEFKYMGYRWEFPYFFLQ